MEKSDVDMFCGSGGESQGIDWAAGYGRFRDKADPQGIAPSAEYESPSLFNTVLCFFGLHQMRFVRNATTYTDTADPIFVSFWECKFGDYKEILEGWVK